MSTNEFSITHSRALRLENEAKGSGGFGKVPWRDELVAEASTS
jgi:hypothetical protein